MRYLPWLLVLLLTAGGGYQAWSMQTLRQDAAETHRQLTLEMNEGYELRAELKDMTLEAHPFIKNGQVGPTASLELQCMQFQGLLPKPPAKDD